MENPNMDVGTAIAQSDTPETNSPETPVSTQATPASQENKGAKLAKLLERDKDPSAKFNDAELDILEEHYSGKLKPSKTKQANQEAEPEAKEVEEISPPKAEEEETESEDAEVEDEEVEESDKPDPDIEALKKEVGAKDLKDALAKVKELRKQLGGKDAQAVARLSKENDHFKSLVQNERNLMEDVRKGIPEAIAHFEKTYGMQLSKSNQTQSEQPKNTELFIDPDKFIDSESAEMVNNTLRQFDSKFKTLEQKLSVFEELKAKHQNETALQKAQLSVIDEMVTVAQRIDALKGIPNLREAISDFQKGKSDPRLEVFNELFDIAGKEGTNLQAAWTIKRGLEADRLIEEAKQVGRKEAYSHKPNPSLSGMQGANGESTYKPLSDQQIDAMGQSEGYKLMPNDWFDKDGNPIESKIPKKAWNRLFA